MQKADTESRPDTVEQASSLFTSAEPETLGLPEKAGKDACPTNWASIVSDTSEDIVRG